MRVAMSAVFDAPPERTWSVLADWERQASWMPDVAWMRVVGHERELGARLLVRTKVFGIPAVTDRLVVTTWEPPSRLAVQHLGLVKGSGEWRLTPVDDGTRFDWIEVLSLPLGMAGELALRAYGPVQRAMLTRSVRNLRRLVERR
jgi:uncharacterized protein YndB with AHSA1/START domain